MSPAKGKKGKQAKTKPPGGRFPGFGGSSGSTQPPPPSSLFGTKPGNSPDANHTSSNSGSLFGNAFSNPSNSFFNAASTTTSSSALITASSSTQIVPDPRLSAAQDVDITGSVFGVRVGEPASMFYVHRSVLRKLSEFLKTKLEAELNKIDSEPVIHLPDQPAEGFLIYSKWVYTGGIMATAAVDTDPPTPNDNPGEDKTDEGQADNGEADDHKSNDDKSHEDESDAEESSGGEDSDDDSDEEENEEKDEFKEDDAKETCSVNDKSEWLNLARAYVLGQAVVDINFKDTVIDAMRAKVKSASGPSIWLVASELVRIIYNGTPEDSPARRFLVDLYHGHAGEGDMEKGVFPSDFLFDLTRAALTRCGVHKTPVTNLGGSSVIKCKYHEHGENACYADRKR